MAAPRSASLAPLIAALQPTDGDVVEATFDTNGAVGGLVYPRARRSAEAFQALFSSLRLSPPTTGILWTLLSHLPAERHAVRVVSGRGGSAVSVFFKLDLAPDGVVTLGRGLGLAAFGECAAGLFAALGQPACGLAVELGDERRAPRLRFYGMIRGPGAPGTIDCACRRAGIAEPDRREMLITWAELAGPEQDVVLNVGSERRSVASLKLEFPAVPQSSLAARLRFDSSERSVWAEASGYARGLGRDRFAYVGLRWACHRRRTVTFYADATAAAGDAP